MAYIPNPNQSVSGTVGASVIGLPPVNLNVGGNPVTTANPVPVQPPASGSFPITNVGSVITVSQGSVAVAIISGSIAASFTPPANQSVSGTVQTDVRGSVATVIIGGSIAASFTPPANQSVSGAISVSNFPTTQNVSGSVISYQLPGSILATSATVNPAANQSVSGTVQTDVRGSVAAVIIGGSILTTTGNSSVQVLNFPTNQSVSGAVSVSNFPGITSLVSTVPSSVIVGTSIFGQLPAGTAVLGSVAALQGTNPWIITGSVQGTFSAGNSSVQVLNFPTNQSVSGTVGATQIGSWSASVGGTVSVLGTVPVTQSGSWTTSVFTATPGTPIRYSGSTVSTSVTLIAASAAGKRNYITDFWVSNTGSSTTLLTFKDGSTSVLGYTIAPTGGGSNAPGITTPIVAATAQDLTFQNSTATSVLYVTVNGYQI